MRLIVDVVTSAAEVRETFCSMLTVGEMRNPRSGHNQKKFKKHLSDFQDFRKFIYEISAPGWASSVDGFRQVGPSTSLVSPASQLVCGSWAGTSGIGRCRPDRARKHEASEVIKGCVLFEILKNNLVLTAPQPLYPQYPAFLNLDQFSDSKEYQLEQFKQDALLIKFPPALPIPIIILFGSVTHIHLHSKWRPRARLAPFSFANQRIKSKQVTCRVTGEVSEHETPTRTNARVLLTSNENKQKLINQTRRKAEK
jgi:hypothetical protein